MKFGIEILLINCLKKKANSLFYIKKKKHQLNQFQWHCKEGLVSNIKKLIDEFNLFRGLRPNRILIQGPPGSGKSFFAKKLSGHYNIPHIKVQPLVEQIRGLKNELGEEINTVWEELKEKAVSKKDIIIIYFIVLIESVNLFGLRISHLVVVLFVKISFI